MESLFVLTVVAASIGIIAYRNGKRTGSRKGFNVGRHRSKRR